LLVTLSAVHAAPACAQAAPGFFDAPRFAQPAPPRTEKAQATSVSAPAAAVSPAASSAPSATPVESKPQSAVENDSLEAALPPGVPVSSPRADSELAQAASPPAAPTASTAPQTGTGDSGAITVVPLHATESATEPAAGPSDAEKQAWDQARKDAGVKVGEDYRAGPEDVLEIAVWKEESLKKEVLVRPDGGISFPLVGEIQAAGKTTTELRQEITDKLKKLIRDPVVSVAVLKVSANRIYVIGRVNRPGEYTAGRYIDVLQALTMAGGLTPFASENDIKVVRKEQGKDVVLPFRYADVRNGQHLEQNVMLRNGDVVIVP
jgi:polysaccharide export outer membrane protein